MPIQFHCPQCGHLLQTPDGTEGKKARCPSCAEVVDVPMASELPADSSPMDGGPPVDDGFGFSEKPPKPESPLSESPLSESPFSDAAADTFNPYASPAGAATYHQSTPPEGPERSGPPWEREGYSVGTFWTTTKQVLTQSQVAFSTIRRHGGLSAPLLFGVIGNTIGGVLGAIWNAGMQGVMGGPGDEIGVSFISTVIVAPISAVIGLFLGAAFTHLMLILLKGANYDYETTFRAVAYTSGATSLLQAIPCVGPLLAFVGAIVVQILALSGMHDISGGKAAAAVLLPIVICGGLCLVLVFTVGGVAFMQGMQGM